MADQLKRQYSSAVGSLKYLLYLPPDYQENNGVKWPLLVFLHGWGECGDDLDLLMFHGIPRVIAQSEGFPFVAVSPQAPLDTEWQTLTGLLMDFVQSMIEEYGVDQNQIYLTGLSTGGTGAWALAVENPSVFAALAPIAANIPDVDQFMERVEVLRDVPVWVFHGARDDIYLTDNSDLIVARLRSAKGDIRYTVYPEAGHDSWTETYGDPEFYNWILARSRSCVAPESG